MIQIFHKMTRGIPDSFPESLIFLLLVQVQNKACTLGFLKFCGLFHELQKQSIVSGIFHMMHKMCGGVN